MPGEKRHTRTVTLEVESPSDPISGIARDERGTERAFSGWVGLATALELTLGLRAPPTAPVETEEQGG